MADQKITELTELLTPEAADLLAIVDDPSGSAETKKIALSNLAVMLTGNQDVAGEKTFSDILTIGEYAFPLLDGTADQVLTTDGAGALTFEDSGGGGAQHFQDYSIENEAQTPVGTAVTLDYENGPAFEIDLESATGTVTATLSNAPASGDYGQMIVRVQQDGTTPIGLIWAGGTFLWPDGTQHMVTSDADGISLFFFETWDGGTTWHAAGSDYS